MVLHGSSVAAHLLESWVVRGVTALRNNSQPAASCAPATQVAWWLVRGQSFDRAFTSLAGAYTAGIRAHAAVLLYACSCAPRLPILRSVPVHRRCHRCAGMRKHGALAACVCRLSSRAWGWCECYLSVQGAGICWAHGSWQHAAVQHACDAGSWVAAGISASNAWYAVQAFQATPAGQLARGWLICCGCV